MFLLRLLLLFFIFMFILFLLVRVLLPYKFRQLSKKMKEQAEEQQRAYKQSEKKEGEVTIDNPQKAKNRTSSSQGEYVDYEEIKDE